MYRAAHARLVQELEAAKDSTHLPDAVPENLRRAVSDLVVRAQLGEIS